MHVIIYGAGESGQKILRELTLAPFVPYESKPFKVLAFADGNAELWGKRIGGVEVIAPENICNYPYDKIIVATLLTTAKKAVQDRLINALSVPIEKIDLEYIDAFTKSRYRFLLDQAEIIYTNNINGSVAEVGVWRGDYARYINSYFFDRDLYLFDTFAEYDSAYDEHDIREDEKRNLCGTLLSDPNVFRDTSIEYVRSILPYPEKAIFKVGYFPESASNVDCKFAFVNLDVNLYSTTLKALEFFYPKMSKGGVILCHDFFSWDVEPGASIAVKEFCNKYSICYIAIGDRLSVAIIKC